MSSHSNTVKQEAKASKSNSKEREVARTILEDVCSDFETMNVVSSKSKNVGVIRNLRTRNSVQQGSVQKHTDTTIQKGKDSSSKTSTIKRDHNEKSSSLAINKEIISEISAINDVPTNELVTEEEINENNVHTNTVNQDKNKINKTVENSVASETEHLQSSAGAASVKETLQSSADSDAKPSQSPMNSTVLNTRSDVDSKSLPLNSSQEAGSTTSVPKSYSVDKNLSSIAQLADAEIVQSGDNVSIIVSNPRFIEVLTDSSAPISTLQPGTVIESPAAVLETTTRHIELVDSLLENGTFEELTIVDDDFNLIQEENDSQKTNIESPKKVVRGRGRPPKSSNVKSSNVCYKKPISRKSESPPRSYIPSSHFSRGRRITARMKAVWTKLLEMDGRLVCQMPGCSQTFVTVANFQTHFKYCSGRKTLKKCNYCDSMIFSTHKAILQHMEVEHPEKADEYRAAHQEEILEFEKNNAPDHLIIAEDENVAMVIEEVTQTSQSISRKRKLSEKEIGEANKKAKLKHKMESIQNSMAENAKEFKKCVRFDSITDAIKSVKISSFEEACRVETPRKKDRRLKHVFNEKIVAADKYFEDDDDDVDQPKEEDEKEREKQELRERMHTKARLMLNLERYKRYQEYLTVTRDWSSERKTYSRSRGSDVSAENSLASQTANGSFQDCHQLNVTESSNISLNIPEAEINSIQMTPVETYQVVETPQFVSAVALEPDDVLTSTPKNINTISLNLSLNETEPIQPFTYGENRVRREKTACYNRVNFDNSKSRSKAKGVITFGVQIPIENADKPVELPVTFDSLVNTKPLSARRNSQAEDIENIPKPVKEDGIKLPNKKGILTSPKKRGRPPKYKIDPTVDPNVAIASLETEKMQKGHAKKYSAAMLKTIERNVKNKNLKLFRLKKKFKSKNYASVQVKNNLRNIRLKQSKNSLSAKEIGVKKKKRSKSKAIDIASIQCQENIDNHLPIGQGINISNITCLSSNSSYTNTLNQLIVDANIAGEIEIAVSNTEEVLETVADRSANLSENAFNENVCSELVNKEIENVDLSNMPEIISQISEEKNSQNEAKTEIVDKGKLNDANSAETVNKENLSDANSAEIIDNEKLNNVKTPEIVDKEKLDDANLAEIVDKEKLDDANLAEIVDKVKLDDANLAEIVDKEKLDDANLAEIVDKEKLDDANLAEIVDKEKLDDANLAEIVDKGKLNDVNSIEKDNNQEDVLSAQKLSDSAIMIQKNNDDSANLLLKDTESNDTCVKLVSNDFENDKSDLSSVQDNVIKNTFSDKQLLSSAEDSALKQSSNDNVPSNNLNANCVERVPETYEMSQSDINKKVENIVPEVPVKRGRGRPRKNSKKSGLTVPDVKTPEKNTLKDNEIEKSKAVEENAKICSEIKDNNAISEISGIDNAVTDNKTFPTVRKSERIRRRKLVDDEIFEIPVIDTKQKVLDTASTPSPQAQSGRSHRGRPRKCPIQEPPVETADNKEDDSKEKTPETEIEIIDENQRKFSRKGRPRKCVRYADLNSGLENSESMDGIHGGSVVKKDSEKEKHVKSVQKTQISKEVPESSADVKEQEENIVLPLKKRKQRQTKKCDPELAKSKHEEIIAEEILLSEEEKQITLEENEDSSEKKNSQNRKRGTKRKKHGTDTSDEEWDPEVHLKSLRKSSNRKSQRDILEMEESSDSSYSERRYPLKRDGDSFHKIAARLAKTKRLDVIAAKHSIKATKDLFIEYKPQKWMWKILSGDDYILPPMKTSPFFKIEKMWEETTAYWNSLDLFESAPLDKDSCHYTFFTGGPVTCSGWCPTPVEGNRVQYIALAVSHLMNKYHSYVCEEPEGGFLQLWNTGDLNKEMLERKPFLELSIFHKYGPINDMAWCPYGCWENPEVESASDTLPRLGLLAVACSDSNIRIYSIPHPHLLPKEGTTSFPVYSAYPSVVLETLCSDLSLATRKSICISLSWQKTDHCERIAAGYGCGMICVWLVNSTATILATRENNQIIIKPYLVFNGHGTPVLGLSFAPLPCGRFLVSTGIDKTLKFWDLIDTSLPVYAVKKGAGKCAHWSNYYCGAFCTVQHGMFNSKGSSFFKECGTETISKGALSHTDCSISFSSLSDWLHAIAIGDCAGNVSVSFTHCVIHDHSKGPQYFQRYVYESELKPVEGITEKIIFSSYPESVKCIETIQEMKEISVLLDEVVLLVCKVVDIVENSITQKVYEKSCQRILDDVNEVVSVVDHLIENSKPLILDSTENAIDDIQNDSTQTISNESVKEYNVKDQRENMLNKFGPSELSEITDIVTVVTEVNDVTETTSKLLMEVEDSENLSRTVQLLDSLIDTVVQDEVSHLMIELLHKSEQVLIESIVTDIHSEGIACISAVDEMSDIVTVMESIEEICAESDYSNVLLENMSENTHVQSEDAICISTVDEISKIITAVEDLTENCTESEMISSGNESDSIKKHIYNGIELLHSLSETVDVVSVVSDVQEAAEALLSMGDVIDVVSVVQNAAETVSDTAEVISNVKDTTAVVCDLKNITESVLDMRDVILSSETMTDVVSSTEAIKDVILSTEAIKDVISSTEAIKDVISSTEAIKDVISSAEDLKDVTVITEKLKNKVGNNRFSECATLSVVNDILEYVVKDNCESEAASVMDNLISNVHMLIKSADHENKKSQDSTADLSLKEKCLLSFEASSNSSTSAIETKQNSIKCNLSKNFDYQLPELPDNMDEHMLSAESESSNSDNEMDFDDELEVDDSYIFDQDSNLSDDSILSECSLNSAASICSISTESDMSMDSATSNQGQHEPEDFVPSHDAANTIKMTPEPPTKLTDLTFEGKIVSNSEGSNMECKSERVLANVSDSVPTKDSDVEVAVQDTNLNSVTDVADSINVPDSQNIISPGDKSVSETIDKTLNSSFSKVENVPLNSELPTDTSDQVEANAVISGDALVVDSSNKTDNLIQTGNVQLEIPCDNSIITEHKEIPETTKILTDSSNVICFDESTDKNVESLKECLPNNVNNSVLHETIESVSKPNEIPVVNVVNSELGVNHEGDCISSKIKSCPVSNKINSETFSCYEDVISQYGIVFKDTNTARFDKIEAETIKDYGKFCFSDYSLASIKTVSWNPNHGSHHWLLSAGQSGIVRLSYISDIYNN